MPIWYCRLFPVESVVREAFGEFLVFRDECFVCGGVAECFVEGCGERSAGEHFSHEVLADVGEVVFNYAVDVLPDVAGFYAAKTHRVIAADACPLHPPVFAEIVREICAFAKENGISAYDEATGKGLLRHIYLRMGASSGEILVCPVINGQTLPHAKELTEILCRRFPAVCGIVLNHNTKNTNVVLGDTFTPVWGKPYLTDVLCGLTLAISPAAFYQVNHDAAELLYGIAAEKADLHGDETLLDLYCGIGSIGLSMAHRVKSVFGIEIVPEAVTCAGENAARNGIDNARFVCGDASDAEKFLAAAAVGGAPVNPGVVVLDPPRKGTTPELINAIAKRQIPKVVYISCNHVTLARDCALFREHGYAVGPVTPVDLFPRTGHVETVVLLSKRNV